MEKLNTVLIGCGAISKKHIDGIRQNAEAYELTGVFDIDGGRAQATAKETGTRAFTDMEERAIQAVSERL